MKEQSPYTSFIVRIIIYSFERVQGMVMSLMFEYCKAITVKTTVPVCAMVLSFPSSVG